MRDGPIFGAAPLTARLGRSEHEPRTCSKLYTEGAPDRPGQRVLAACGAMRAHRRADFAESEKLLFCEVLDWKTAVKKARKIKYLRGLCRERKSPIGDFSLGRGRGRGLNMVRRYSISQLVKLLR